MSTFSAGKPELGDLIKSTYKSFELVESWFLAVSDHRDVQQITMDLQRQGNNYYDALDGGLTAARNGFGLSDNCEKLCEYLEEWQENRTAEPGEVREMVVEMKKTADAAHKEALVVCNMFRCVREGLLQVSVSINILLKILEEATRKFGDVRRTGSRYDKKDSFVERSASVHSSEELVDWLNQADHFAKSLEHYVSDDVSWWVSCKTQIANVKLGLDQLDPNRLRQLRVRASRRSWMEARSEYEGYISAMQSIQEDSLASKSRNVPARNTHTKNMDGGFSEPMTRSSIKPEVKIGASNPLGQSNKAPVPLAEPHPEYQTQALSSSNTGTSSSVKAAFKDGTTIPPKTESESPPVPPEQGQHEVRTGSVKPAFPREVPWGSVKPAFKGTSSVPESSPSLPSADSPQNQQPEGVNNSRSPEYQGLRDSPAPGTKLRDFRESAYKSFVSIEPWKHTASEMKLLIPIVSQLKDISTRFCSALESSVETSCSGYFMSTSCKELYLSILDGASSKDVGLNISGLRRQNRRAASKLTASRKSFKLVGGGFLKATSDVTHIADRLSVFGVTSKDLKSFLTIESELALYAPVEGGDTAQQDILPARTRVHRDIEEAKSSLQLASAVVLEVDERVNQLLSWWKNVDSELNALQTQIKVLDQGSTFKLDVGKQVKAWGDSAVLFKNYNLTMDDLQNLLSASAGDSGVSEGE